MPDSTNLNRPIATVKNCANAASGTNRTWDIGFTYRAASTDNEIPWDNSALPVGWGVTVDGRSADYSSFFIDAT